MLRTLPFATASLLALCAHAQQWEIGVPSADVQADEWIGVRHGPSCPVAPGWTVTSPFEQLVEPEAAYFPEACRYQWNGPGPAEPQTLPPESGRVDWLERETWSIRPQSTDLLDLIGGDLYLNWRMGSGSSTLDPLPAPAVAGPRPYIVVIDTCTDMGCPDTPETRHGYLVTQTIENLTHPSGATDLADVDHVRAIGSRRDNTGIVEPTNGGAFGTQSDLSTAILQAVARWKDAGIDRPLIINLSLGWQRKYGMQLDPTLDGAGQVVRMPTSAWVSAALRYARCHGALIVAASGNQTKDDENDGMLMPAAWTDQTAPDSGVCLFSVGSAPAMPSGASVSDPVPTAPLLYTATATDAVGNLAGTARALSSGVFRAPGQQIVTPKPGGFNGSFGGSSAATAIVSGAAAVLWAYQPNLTATEIADLLFATGQWRSPAARSPSSMTESVSIDLCRALETTCLSGSASCPPPEALPTCAPLPLSTPTASSTHADIDAEVVWDIDADASGFSSYASCAVGLIFSPSAITTCPVVWPTLTTEALVWPQPIEPPCEVCILLDEHLIAKMRSDVESPKILEKLSDSIDLKSLLPGGMFKAGETYTIKLPIDFKSFDGLMIGGEVVLPSGKSASVYDDLAKFKE